MVFDRFFRSASGRAPRFAFYGKLPFDREFLRYHLDGAHGRWVTSWVDGAHQLMAAHREEDGVSIGAEVRAAIARDGGRSVLAALIRPSTDGGGRSYPSCAFCVLPAAALRDAWHLSPLWLEPIWQSMAEHILGAAPANRTDFAEVIDRAVPELEEPEAISTRFERASTTPVQQPWQHLTGASGGRARSLAVTLVQLGRVQRDARGGRGSIAVRIPLNPTDGRAPSLQAALWLRIFSVASAFDSVWPAVIEVRRLSEPVGRELCIFGREATSEDLADLLSGSGVAPIDDVGDAWEVEPEAEEDQRHVEVLVDKTSTCLAELWEKMS